MGGPGSGRRSGGGKKGGRKNSKPKKASRFDLHPIRKQRKISLTGIYRKEAKMAFKVKRPRGI